jgi:hypothetical protein
MSFAERVYKALLGLYPKNFRERYGLEMLQTFRDSHRQARLEGKAFAFWLGTLTDAISSAIREHAREGGIEPMMLIVRIGAVGFVLSGLGEVWQGVQWLPFLMESGRPNAILEEVKSALFCTGLIGFAISKQQRPNTLEWVGYILICSYWLFVPFIGLSSASDIIQRYAAMISLGALGFGRAIIPNQRLSLASAPLESRALLVLVVWNMITPLLAGLIVPAFGNSFNTSNFPLGLRVYLMVFPIPTALASVILGYALWRKSSTQHVPPRAKTA